MNKVLRKITVIAFIFVFALQPMAPLFAQEAGSSSSGPASSEVSSPTISTPTTDNTTPDTQITPPVDTTPDFSLTTPAIPDVPATPDVSVPDVPATTDVKTPDVPAVDPEAQNQTSGQNPSQAPSSNSQLTQKLPEIDKNTGALSYNFPVSLPSGRNNLQPEIALSYNSNLNEQNSVFGYGWSISIPYIQRLNKTGIDSLFSSNYFYSSLDGELSSVDNLSYVPRIENGGFNKYTFQNNQWLVVAKDGTQYKFGFDNVSQQNDPSNPSNVYKWMLEEVRDTNDNYISYSYFKDAGQIYPLAIKYTGNGATDGIFEINFQRTSRQDNSVLYTTGFAVNSNYLISEIDANINGDWENKYVLAYTQSPNKNRPLLNSITASGKDASGNITTLPTTSFNYQTPNSGWLENSAFNLPLGLVKQNDSFQLQFVDLNGDGLPDFIESQAVQNPSGLKSKIYINIGSSWAENSAFNLPLGLFKDDNLIISVGIDVKLLQAKDNSVKLDN